MKKVISILLVFVLCVGLINPIAVMADSSGTSMATADGQETVVSEFTALTDADGSTKSYSLLQPGAEPFTLAEGETMVISLKMDPATAYAAGRMIGFNIKDGNDLQYPDIGVYANLIKYKKPDSESLSSAEDLDKGLQATQSKQPAWWSFEKIDQDDTKIYPLEIIVKAYESVTFIRYSYSATGAVWTNITVPWKDMYNLADVTEESGATFSPSIVFKDVDAKVKDIHIYKTGDIVSQINVTQNTSAEKRSLLAHPSVGVSLQEGDIWTITADITMNTQYVTSGTTSRFGIDICKNIRDDEADLFIKDTELCYRKLNDQYLAGAKDNASGSPVVWQWGTNLYHLTWTIKAYESVTMKMVNPASNWIRETTIPWKDVESIQNAQVTDNVTFSPNLLFRNMSATVTNIQSEITSGNINKTQDVETCANFNANNATTGTIGSYSLLQSGAEPLILKKGDTMVISLKLDPATQYGEGRQIGFNIKGGNDLEYPDIGVYGNLIKYKQTEAQDPIHAVVYETSQNAIDSKQKAYWGFEKIDQDDTKIYPLEIIVKAYESVTFIRYSYSATGAQWNNITVPWGDMYNLAGVTEESDATFSPSIVFKDVDAIVKDVKITIDYNLSPYAMELKEMVTAANLKIASVTSPSYQSEKMMEEWYIPALAARKNISQLTYAKMTGIIRGLKGIVANYKTSAMTFSLNGASELKLAIAEGEKLPVNCEVEGKYIYGWSTEDTHFESGHADKYEPKFVDTKMLEVKAQSRVNPNNAERTDIRFISSVNDAKHYDEAGFVFSLSDSEPEIGKSGCYARPKTTVYKEIYAASNLINAQQAGYSQYSTSMFTHGFSNFTTDMEIYARAYAKVAGTDTVVYGEIVKIQVDGVNSISKGE